MIVDLLMRYRAWVVVLFAVAGCKRPPARLVAGLADTVIVNNGHPVRMPVHVFDAAGHLLPDTGVRFQWTSGAPIPVSSRGVVTCKHAGDATLRASLGPLVKRFPHAVTVRFHLGLMLLWIGQLQAAKAQLEKVVAAGPSPFLADTRLLLAKLPRK